MNGEIFTLYLCINRGFGLGGKTIFPSAASSNRYLPLGKRSTTLYILRDMEDIMNSKAHEASVSHTEFSSPCRLTASNIPEVTWWKHPGLRKLYFMMPILFLGNT